jgi:hypothetical protein
MSHTAKRWAKQLFERERAELMRMSSERIWRYVTKELLPDLSYREREQAAGEVIRLVHDNAPMANRGVRA